MGKGLAAAARDASLAHDASAAHARLNQLVSQLQGLKRKVRQQGCGRAACLQRVDCLLTAGQVGVAARHPDGQPLCSPASANAGLPPLLSPRSPACINL